MWHPVSLRWMAPVCQRMMQPIIGPEPDLPGLYLAVMHSGVTLAAAAGRLIAEEVTTGHPAPELAGCRRRAP